MQSIMSDEKRDRSILRALSFGWRVKSRSDTRLFVLRWDNTAASHIRAPISVLRLFPQPQTVRLLMEMAIRRPA